MDVSAMKGLLAFIKRAENLKNTCRFSFTSTGGRESAAEHSWRLCLLIMTCAGSVPGLDLEKCLKMAVIHDLAEAECGDTPAIYQDNHAAKAGVEEQALRELTAPLSAPLQTELLELWKEYESAATREAVFVKALDKLETLIQHNQGRNPPDFDYAFNLSYGAKWTNAIDVCAKLRTMIDADTQARLKEQAGHNGDGSSSWIRHG